MTLTMKVRPIIMNVGPEGLCLCLFPRVLTLALGPSWRTAVVLAEWTCVLAQISDSPFHSQPDLWVTIIPRHPPRCRPGKNTLYLRTGHRWFIISLLIDDGY